MAKWSSFFIQADFKDNGYTYRNYITNLINN